MSKRRLRGSAARLDPLERGDGLVVIAGLWHRFGVSVDR
jgi:hypothetical protein